MLIFNALLVDVQDGEYKSLIFEATRFDSRLNKKVIYAESVGISKDCEKFISSYLSHVGEVVQIGVSALVTKKNSIFLLAVTDIIDVTVLSD